MRDFESEFKDRLLEVRDWAESDEEREEISWRLRDYLETIFYPGDSLRDEYRVKEFEANGFDEDDFKYYVEATAGTVNWAR